MIARKHMREMGMFTISFPDTHLSVADVWPDGDAPENPTPEDVAAVMRVYGGVISDWKVRPSYLEVDGVVVR